MINVETHLKNKNSQIERNEKKKTRDNFIVLKILLTVKSKKRKAIFWIWETEKEERVRFELTEPWSSFDFKSNAIDHSAIFPKDDSSDRRKKNSKLIFRNWKCFFSNSFLTSHKVSHQKNNLSTFKKFLRFLKTKKKAIWLVNSYEYECQRTLSSSNWQFDSPPPEKKKTIWQFYLF